LSPPSCFHQIASEYGVLPLIWNWAACPLSDGEATCSPIAYWATGPRAFAPAHTVQLSQLGMVWIAAWVTPLVGAPGAANVQTDIPKIAATGITQRLVAALNISSDTPELSSFVRAISRGATMESKACQHLDQSISTAGAKKSKLGISLELGACVVSVKIPIDAFAPVFMHPLKRAGTEAVGGSSHVAKFVLVRPAQERYGRSSRRLCGDPPSRSHRPLTGIHALFAEKSAQPLFA
jgi:hypothetical protein